MIIQKSKIVLFCVHLQNLSFSSFSTLQLEVSGFIKHKSSRHYTRIELNTGVRLNARRGLD
jgi:hypothetical protein